MQNKEVCIYCERSSQEVPLIFLRSQGQDAWICPQHLPILIHQPHLLGDKLPGASNLTSAEEH